MLTYLILSCLAASSVMENIMPVLPKIAGFNSLLRMNEKRVHSLKLKSSRNFKHFIKFFLNFLNLMKINLVLLHLQ